MSVRLTLNVIVPAVVALHCDMPICRRALMAGAATGLLPGGLKKCAAATPEAPSSWLVPEADAVDSGTAFSVVPDCRKFRPTIIEISPTSAVQALAAHSDPEKGQALFIGEHHDSAMDHLMQADIITKVREAHPKSSGVPMAVGLEAIQRKFQPALDAYGRGELSEAGLRVAVEWDKRWSWPFERYLPALRSAREAGATLLALNVDSEDLATVQVSSFRELGPERMAQYIPDSEGFAAFCATTAFKEYCDYVVRPSYVLHKQLGLLRRDKMGGELAEDLTFRNFLSSRLLSDESMGSHTAGWLKRNPGGVAIALVGNDHVKFGCGAAARCGRAMGGIQHVRTLLLNPTNADTSPRTGLSSAKLPLTALQLQYTSETPNGGDDGSPITPSVIGGRELSPSPGSQDVLQANLMAQAPTGSSVMPLADFLWFSRRLSVDEVLW
jgi:uncharacterized iron-regulated protein